MRYITLISSRTYHRPLLGRADAGSAMCFIPLERPLLRELVAANCPFLAGPASERVAADELPPARYSAARQTSGQTDDQALQRPRRQRTNISRLGPHRHCGHGFWFCDRA